MAADPGLEARHRRRPIIGRREHGATAGTEQCLEHRQEITWRRQAVEKVERRDEAETARRKRQRQGIAAPEIDALAAGDLDRKRALVIDDADAPALIAHL